MVNFLGEEKNGRFKTNVLDFYWLKQRVCARILKRGSVFARC
jgi:hypothetical protein